MTLAEEAQTLQQDIRDAFADESYGPSQGEIESLLSRAEATLGALLVERETRDWQPIETIPGPDYEAVLWTPPYRLSHYPDQQPDMRIGTPRHWTWATHWREKPTAPSTEGQP